MSLAAKRVPLKSRPDLEIYVRSHSALEELDQRTVLEGVTDEKIRIASMLAFYVSDETGKPRFANTDEAFEFMRTVKGGVVTKLIKEGQAYNEITDEAIEEEQKN
jgi:hypothetical protein